jgi:hypothetical protein
VLFLHDTKKYITGFFDFWIIAAARILLDEFLIINGPKLSLKKNNKKTKA